MEEPIRLAILTVSDGVAAGLREDRSGQTIREWAQARGYRLTSSATVADERGAIADRLRAWCDSGAVDVVLTTGGTGFTDRDVTPEATRAVMDRPAPGLPEAIRARGAASTPYAWLSRAEAGLRSRTLVVNLPGSEGGVRDGLAVLGDLLPHAVRLLRGDSTDRHP